MPRRLTDRERLDRSVAEDVVLGQLMQVAQIRNLPRVHFRPAQLRSGAWVTPFEGDEGFPDLVIAAAPVLYLLETKKELAKPKPEQEAWLAALGACTRVVVDVVRPSNVQEYLDRLAR